MKRFKLNIPEILKLSLGRYAIEPYYGLRYLKDAMTSVTLLRYYNLLK